MPPPGSLEETDVFFDLALHSLEVTGVAVRLRQRLRIVGRNVILEVTPAEDGAKTLGQLERTAVLTPESFSSARSSKPRVSITSVAPSHRPTASPRRAAAAPSRCGRLR